MRTERPTKCFVPGEGVHVKLVKVSQYFITDRSKAVVFLCFSVACFWCQSFGDVTCVHIIFSSVWVAAVSVWEIAAVSVDHNVLFVF